MQRQNSHLDPKPLLLSTSIVNHGLGHFEWYEIEWLFPHEAIRRELLRAEWAISHMDIFTHPWKVTRFRVWLLDYFLRALDVHHLIEDDIIGPYFQEKGETIEFGNEECDHVALFKLVAELTIATKALDEKIGEYDYSTVEIQVELRGLFEAFKQKFAAFKELLFRHLLEEEICWMQIYMAHDQTEMKALRERIMDMNTHKTGNDLEIVRALTGSMLDAIGCCADESKDLECGKHMPPWCSEKIRKEIVNDVPYFPRVFLYPSWHKDYVRKWKRMIDSIAGDEDICAVELSADSQLCCIS